jgi:4-carboxymuconolactone decarboxylase
VGDLVGVAETALVTAGMPAYGLGIEVIAELTETPRAPGGDVEPAQQP